MPLGLTAWDQRGRKKILIMITVTIARELTLCQALFSALTSHIVDILCYIFIKNVGNNHKLIEELVSNVSPH